MSDNINITIVGGASGITTEDTPSLTLTLTDDVLSGTVVESALTTKANAADVYTQAQLDLRFADHYTRAETDAAIAAGGGGGASLPAGGTTGQVLSKASNADGDATWSTVTSGPALAGDGSATTAARSDHQHAVAGYTAATAIGPGARAEATWSTAVGGGAQTTATSATAVGRNATATAFRATAIGYAATASVSDTAVIKANDLEVQRSSGTGTTRLRLASADNTTQTLSLSDTDQIEVGGVAHTHPTSEVAGLGAALALKANATTVATLTPAIGQVVMGTARGPIPITTANPIEALSRGLDDFSDTDAWTATNSATLTQVTSDPSHGPVLQIATTTTTPGTSTTITRDLAFSMKKRFVSFWMKRTDANFDRLVLGLSVRGRTFTSLWQGTVKREAELVLNRWHRVTVSVSLTASGSPVPTWADLEDIRALRMDIVPKAGVATTVQIADLRLHDHPLPPGVIWQFDDGRANTYDVAFPILQARGVRGALPLETGNLGNANRMTLAQVQELYAAGWDVNSHTVAGAQLSSSNLTNVRTQLRDSYAFLMNNGLTRGAKHFIYPGGTWDGPILTEVLRIYTTGRTIGAIPGIGYETAGVADMGILRPYYFGHASISLAAAKGAVDLLAERGGLAIFCFHNIDSGTMTQPESWDVNNFIALVDYAREKGLVDHLPSEVWPS